MTIILHVVINGFTFIVLNFQLLLRKNPGFVQNIGSCLHAGRKELIYNLGFVNLQSCMSIKVVANNNISYQYKFGFKFKQCMYIYMLSQTLQLN